MHASFPAHGSSTSQADLRSNPAPPTTERPLRYWYTGTRLWQSQRRGRTDGWSNHLHLFLLSPFKVFCARSRNEAPVGRGLTFVPGNLETRIRPITGRHSLLPTSQARTSISSPYGSPSLAGEDTGLPRSAPEVCAGLGTCCRPGSSVDHEVAPLNPPPTSVPFGSSLSATLAWCAVTVVAQVHMYLPYPLPSHRPAWWLPGEQVPHGPCPARLRVPLYIVRAALYSGP